ncbi:putative DNA binding domain-containing protein [Aquiflexum sp. TKW24L]|uniref:RNA-binding domain-containing protein n=1 Tax=Aquiflexum sp. TKW24L TaxID=2942212 RepID=UPI0020BFB7E9|nr:RNA-binding domain-containing protein [Aquiflexum sp. TKW24L]MCL6261474.1 putative DNA binding domain-containing protein [Aquiflexum sp. TKW24L]
MSAKSFIKELIDQQDNSSLVFDAIWDEEDILKTICAFLNSEGGWIIVGHNKNEVIGLPEITNQSVEELKKNALERIFPQPLIYAQLEPIGGKSVVMFNVIKGSRQPYSYNKKYYTRKRSKTVEANPDDISLILRSSNQFTSSWEKLTTIDATFEDLSESEIISTLERANILGKTKSLPENPKDFLSYFQLIDYTAVKNGAVILYGNEPTKFFTQCRIRITNMPEGVTGDQFNDTDIIEDNLFVSYNKVINYLKKNNPIISEFHQDRTTRIDREKYPFFALREAIVNAMVHRDYGDMSGEITINIHKEKIEIINSGEIPSDIISKKNRIESHHSVLRNPTIAHMFFLRGEMEKLGRGLSLIKKLFDESGLKLPEWTFQSGYTTLTLFSNREGIKVNERMIHFLSGMNLDNSYSSEDYLEFFLGEIKDRTARMDLQKLTEGGWLKKVGDGPQTRYTKTNKKLPDNTG